MARRFIAHYRRDGEDVKVVFLAFNMAQAIQRAAAKAAASA